MKSNRIKASAQEDEDCGWEVIQPPQITPILINSNYYSTLPSFC